MGNFSGEGAVSGLEHSARQEADSGGSGSGSGGSDVISDDARRLSHFVFPGGVGVLEITPWVWDLYLAISQWDRYFCSMKGF